MARAFAMIPRDARAPLRHLIDSDYKVLFQLLLTKQQGQTIACGHEMLEDITGVSARTIRDAVRRLVAAKLITYVPGPALGRGRGNGPCRITVLPLPTCYDDPALSFAQPDNADAKSGEPTSHQRHTNVTPTSAIQEISRQEDVVAGARDRAATTTTAARASAHALDDIPEPVVLIDDAAHRLLDIPERLAWLTARGVHVEARADTRGRWVLETDSLSLANLEEILPAGAPVPRWPSEFAKRRDAWMREHGPDPEHQAKRMADRQRAEAAAAAKAKRAADDQLLADQRRAAKQAHDAALKNPLGRLWQGLLVAWGSAAPGCMRYIGTYPLSLTDGRLVLHVGDAASEAAVRRHELAVIDRCRDAFTPAPVNHLDLIVNGHAHPTLAALPTVAVLTH